MTGEIPEKAAEFLAQQRLFFIAVSNPGDIPWGTVVSGDPGFVRASDAGSIYVATLPVGSDPVLPLMVRDNLIGALAIEFESRRRMRANGRIETIGESSFVMTTEQVYSNCAKYITERAGPALAEAAGGMIEEVGPNDVAEAVTRADTVFLGTEAPGEGVDMSHRGGMPGFIRVMDGPGCTVRIVVPDYQGNRYFNSFGNLEVNPLASLLIPDFSTGDTLHLGGVAVVDYDPEHAVTHPGAQRLLLFDVHESLRIRGNVAGGWTFGSFSDANPQLD